MQRESVNTFNQRVVTIVCALGFNFLVELASCMEAETAYAALLIFLITKQSSPVCYKKHAQRH